MHILHVIDSLQRGGFERMLVDIANASVDAGQDVSVCVTRSGLDLVEELHPSIEVLVLHRRRRFDLRAFWRLGHWVRERSVDVIHGHGRSTFALLATGKTFRWLDAPLIFHDHVGLGIDPSVPFWLPWLRARAARYVGAYEEHRTWAREAGFDPEKVEVIENAIDLDRLRPTGDSCRLKGLLAAAAQERAKVLCIGGLRREKGILELLAAWAAMRLDSPVPEPLLLIAGGDRDKDYARACRERAEEPDLAGRVIFLGQRDDVETLIMEADFGVVPSLAESGPLVTIELLAGGLPVVVTQVGSVAQRMQSEGLGEVVPADDAKALSEALRRMLESPPERLEKRRQKGLVLAETFDIRYAMPRWIDLYVDLAVDSP